MNSLLNSLKQENNIKLTENFGTAYKSTLNNVYDLFAFGGAYRQRSDADRILLFKKALAEDESLAMKCLFYLRDIDCGQGERKFFRVCFHWLANNYPEIARRNFKIIPELGGRWDDLYCLVDTPLEKEMFTFMKQTIVEDMQTWINK